MWSPLIIMFCSCTSSTIEKPIKIRLTDSDYALAFSKKYELSEDSIKVIFAGELEQERDTVLFQRRLSSEEADNLQKFLSTFPLAQLNDAYVNPNILDGDQKTFEIQIGRNARSIRVSNYYEENLSRLVELINGLLNGNHKIIYANTSQ